MKIYRSRYSGYRFPPEIISDAVWAYHRFCLSFRDVEDLLAERGIIVSYETIRQGVISSVQTIPGKLKRRESRLGDHWYLDEVFIRINGQAHYLWRAVDQDGDVIDILVQPHRNQRAGAPLPDGPERALIVRVCTKCHGAAVFSSSHMSRKAWRNEVAAMIEKGATGTAKEMEAVVDYLTRNFGPNAK